MRSAETELANHNRTMRNDVGNYSSKTGWISTPKRKKDDFEAPFKRVLKGKLKGPKMRKSADKSLSQPGCSHTNTICNLQLHKTIVLRKQQATLDAAITMRSAETELQNTIELRATASAIAATKPDLDAKAKKKTILKHFLKGFLLSQPGCTATPIHSPCNIHAAMPMRSATTASRNA